jgi:hypothetical protein
VAEVVAIGILGTYLKAGKRKADANSGDVDGEGVSEDVVTTRLL